MEFLLLREIDGEQLDRIAPAFDPEQFKQANPRPTFEDFKLPEEQLESQGKLATEIRKKINERAKEYDGDNDQQQEVARLADPRIRAPYSKPKHNAEGLTEGKLKERRRAEQGYSTKSKKRLLKDLAPEVREDIVRLYEEEHMLQKDVAARFKVSQQLVSRLVCDPKKRAEQSLRIRDSKQRTK